MLNFNKDLYCHMKRNNPLLESLCVSPMTGGNERGILILSENEYYGNDITLMSA